MERSPAVVWTCLLGAGLTLVLPPVVSVTTSEAGPRPPRLIDCVFLHRANVTCRWEAGDATETFYTLQVERRPWGAKALTTISPLNMFSCTTSDTSCTAELNGSSVTFKFCVTVTAHGRSRDASSQRPCQSGRIEVMLPPVTLNGIKSVSGRPQCLNVTWSRTLGVFPVSDSEIFAGRLKSQIEFTAQGQFDVQVQNVTVTDYSFLVCVFRPDTSYTVRLRHRFLGPQSPWSPWSNARQGRTGEDAPSAAPAFWRQVKQTYSSGWRNVSLLWKPLPHFLANGRVLFYNVTCQTETTLKDYGTCKDLHHASTSCSLLLPAGRCSCALTASTSAGSSPEARVWLLGASETEPPAPSQLTARPLDDSRLDVRWTDPNDWPSSGYVVEWFAVGQKNSDVLHWQELNSSCTALVITEGVKPLERYAVSVKALYGERGAGKNRSVFIYTRQGAPSAGPKLKVQPFSGSTVKLYWSPVPVHLLHGFIRNYTLYSVTANQPTRKVCVPGHADSYTLKDLLPGNHGIFMRANTDAGAGAAGPIAYVHIGSEEISIVTCVVLPLTLTALALVVITFAAQNKMLKQKLCQDVPDPSHSSLARWTPKTALESMKWSAVVEKPDMKYSEVVLLGERELQSCRPDLDLTHLQPYSSHCYSPLIVSGAQTPQNSKNIESTRATTTSSTDLSSCPSIYSNVVLSQTLGGHPTPHLQPNDWLQLGGASEPPVYLQGAKTSDSPLSQTDKLKIFHHFLGQHRSLVSDFSHSSILPRHPGEVPSPQHPFSQSICNSLQPDVFARPDALSDNFTTPLSPFAPPVFVDFSYCPVESSAL